MESLEKKDAQRKQYAKDHKEHIAEYQKKYREKNGDKIREQQREYHKTHPPKKRTAIGPRKYDRQMHLKKKYGITESEYDQLLKIQNGCCAICGVDVAGGRGRFHVDHCHKTGVVRGLLCSRCNMGLGSFLDDIEILNKAMKYLSSKVQANV